MKLFDPKNLSVASYLNFLESEVTVRFLMQLLGISKMKKVYSQNLHKSGNEFINSVIEALGLTYEIKPEELKRIPSTGSFITISNHPFGGIDGLLLIKLISEIRPDYKVLASSLFQKIDPIKNSFLPLNVDVKNSEYITQYKEIKDVFNHFSCGNSLGIFPAGEVATYYSDNYKIIDREWNFSLLKFIKKAQVPVVPIYFHGTNSRIYHLLGRIHPLLKAARLPSDLFNKKSKQVNIRIGNPISVKDQNTFGDISRYGRFLRAKTMSLGSTIEVKKFFVSPFKIKKTVEPLIEQIPTEIIEAEIDKVKNDYSLFRNKDYLVICSPSIDIPNIMTEIGRLREITFREVGEGTNRSSDIDEYDLYYYQLVIWDEVARKIVGAYRVGLGKDILTQYGLQGLYLESLFKINKKFLPVLEKSIELGRSFIVKEYQKKPLSLFLLWKGILYFLLKHPEYRYLIGPVSISNELSGLTKNLIVDFIKKHFYNLDFAKYIKPRKEFVFIEETGFDKQIFLDNMNNDIDKLDKIIQDFEPNFRVPVLLKKYIKLNAKIIGFNIDPKFNNALDGLLILDLYDVPFQVIESLSKEINDSTILERFNAG